MAEEIYTSRHTGQEIDDAVDAVQTKADTIAFAGGVKKVPFSQLPWLALWNVEPQESCDADHKLWYCTDGNLYYRENGSISADGKDYNMGHPAYIMYYKDNKEYRWNGSGFTMIGGGDVINDLTTGGESVPLSAEMGKELNDRLTEIEEGGGGGNDIIVDDNENADLDFEDEDGNVIMRLENGHIKTKHFDSSNIPSGGGSGDETKSISILTIGNSLTQDAFSHLPLLLKEIAPNLNFKIYMLHRDGSALYGFWGKFQNNSNITMYYVDNTTSWSSVSQSIQSILSNIQFDVLCMEEYFNYKIESYQDTISGSAYGGDKQGQGYTQQDKETFNNIIGFIRENYSHPFKVISFFHRPRSKKIEGDSAATAADVRNEVYNLIVDGITWQLRNTISDSVLPCGVAAYMSENAGLTGTPDDTHVADGLPSILQSYVVAQWIFDYLAIPKSINGSQTRAKSSYYTSGSQDYINVPGSNGTPVLGTNANYFDAQNIAIAAVKIGKKIEINALIGEDNG